MKTPRKFNRPKTESLLDKANFKVENFKLVKDEIEEIFMDIESKMSQLKKVIWAETDRKEDERCLLHDYD